MRLVFLGTPAIAVPSLEALVGAGHELCRVVSRPDRPRDRGHALAPTPVHAAAQRLGLSVAQPPTLNDPDVRDALRALRPDVFVLVAYGRLVPDALLDLAPDRWINLHPSLLPLYRGPSPIYGPLANGDAHTGVTTMVLRPEMDAGEILLQWETPIGPEETAGELHDRLADLGAECLIETLAGREAGTIAPREQDHARATFTAKLTKADGVLDFRQPAPALRNRVRAVTPWPGATVHLDDLTLKLWRVDALAEGHTAPAGTVLRADADGIVVAAGEGALCIRELQRAHKQRMPADAFLRGCPIAPGARFRLPDTA